MQTLSHQRREPGSGQLDFVALMETVGEMAYAGTLAMEFLLATQVALIAARQKLSGIS
jgi:sugar phosphate isomerase/epimerase